MKKFLITGWISVLTLCAGGIHAQQPNVILIIADDLGYGDIAAHGNPLIQTPALDQLRAESVRFTNFHTDPTCSPTRAALMTGMYSRRAGVWHTILGGNNLRAGLPTLADVFKNSGYNTSLFGKWHLGPNYPYRPMDRGFDEWLGYGDGGCGTADDYFTNDRVNDQYLHNGEWEYHAGFSPDVFFNEARDYLKNRGAKKPFFMVISTYIAHKPYVLPDPEMAKIYTMQDTKMAWYMSGITAVDRNIGLLRQTLKQTGLDENTLLIFMSDNGAAKEAAALFNAGMRGRKAEIYEGGHRVPFFVHWPGGGIQQDTDVTDLNAHIDVLPTLIDLCNLTPEKPLDLDGRSFKAQLFDPAKKLPERMLSIEVQREFSYSKGKNSVVMSSSWRLINQTKLYDLATDPGQKHNVIDQHPERARQMQQAFDCYWETARVNDRERAVVIVGHPSDPETFLSSADWLDQKTTAWHHTLVGNATKPRGSWKIRPFRKGLYRFELRRWPKEANAPLSGAPVLKKQIDSWKSTGPVDGLLYEKKGKSKLKALPVTAVRLNVGDVVNEAAISPTDTCGVFELELDGKQVEVTAELLGANGSVLAGAYYVYVTPVR